ncbi:MAG: hypothetical protein CMJ78_09645 [Planctomycetaceae bacterium]|nr:hypothetical protein [Planctomycetaceae bacterium]
MTRLPLRTSFLYATLAVLVSASVGCQSLSAQSMFSPLKKLASRNPLKFDSPLKFKSPVDFRRGIDASQLKGQEDPNRSIEGIAGPMQRVLQAARFGNTPAENAVPQSSRYSKEFAAAESAFKAGDYASAEDQLRSLVKSTGAPRFANLKLRREAEKKRKHNPVREDAIFLLAESLYEQKKYPVAQSHYALLMKEYPQTRFLDRATGRLFQIAKNWLGFSDFATSSDIQQVNLENPSATPRAAKGRAPGSIPFIPNAFDRSRPVFDTGGRALEALKQIWLNDPTGPLADDALMLTASHHLRSGNHQEADRVFQILREEYSRSPHLKQAFVLGSHVKLMSYQGADYDVAQLEEAERLKKSSLKLFPELPEKPMIEAELRAIQEAKAQRYWERVIFYKKKSRLQSVAVYCRLLLKEFPKSKYAGSARELLAQVEGQAESTGRVLLKPSFDSQPNQLPPGRSERPGRVQL